MRIFVCVFHNTIKYFINKHLKSTVKIYLNIDRRPTNSIQPPISCGKEIHRLSLWYQEIQKQFVILYANEYSIFRAVLQIFLCYKNKLDNLIRVKCVFFLSILDFIFKQVQ
jgi:hypothetical protein